MVNYLTAVLQALSAGINIFGAITVFKADKNPLPLIGFSAFALHGIYCFARTVSDDDLPNPEFIDHLAHEAGFPCLAGQIMVNCGLEKNFQYAQLGISAVPFIMYLADKNNKKARDAITFLNCIGCAVMGAMKQNYIALASGIAFFGYYNVKHQDSDDFLGLDHVDCVFLLLALYSGITSQALLNKIISV